MNVYDRILDETSLINADYGNASAVVYLGSAEVTELFADRRANERVESRKDGNYLFGARIVRVLESRHFNVARSL